MKKQSIYQLLFEQEEAPAKQTTLKDPPETNVSFKSKPGARRASDSVDDQIDSLILMYEQKSIRDDDDKLLESLLKRKLKILLEQEEEAAAEETPEEAPEDTATADDPVGSEEQGDVGPANKDIVPDLNIDKFTAKVARLVMNHRNLLRIEDAIINRAKNFLDENYGDAFVSRYLNDLEERYGISVSEFPSEDVNDAPYAIGANPAGAGISGG